MWSQATKRQGLQSRLRKLTGALSWASWARSSTLKYFLAPCLWISLHGCSRLQNGHFVILFVFDFLVSDTMFVMVCLKQAGILSLTLYFCNISLLVSTLSWFPQSRLANLHFVFVFLCLCISLSLYFFAFVFVLTGTLWWFPRSTLANRQRLLASYWALM